MIASATTRCRAAGPLPLTACAGACEALAQLLFMISASQLPGESSLAGLTCGAQRQRPAPGQRFLANLGTGWIQSGAVCVCVRACAARAAGPLLPVINQSYLVWNLLFAALFLKAKCVQYRPPPGHTRCRHTSTAPALLRHGTRHISCPLSELRGAVASARSAAASASQGAVHVQACSRSGPLPRLRPSFPLPGAYRAGSPNRSSWALSSSRWAWCWPPCRPASGARCWAPPRHPRWRRRPWCSRASSCWPCCALRSPRWPPSSRCAGLRAAAPARRLSRVSRAARPS